VRCGEWRETRIISPPACASQPIEKCEQSIAGFETSRGHARGFDRGQCSLLHREVRGEILAEQLGVVDAYAPGCRKCRESECCA